MRPAVRTPDELVAQSMGQRRLSMIPLGMFAGLALLLASLGVYGVMSYSVARRARDLGVRIALVATFVPAVRATRVDPVVALRDE